MSVPCIVSAEDRLWAAWPGGGAWLRPTKFKLKGVCQSVSDNPSLPPSLINTRTPIGRHRGGGGSTNQRRGWLARRPAKINIWDCMSLTNRELRWRQTRARAERRSVSVWTIQAVRPDTDMNVPLTLKSLIQS